MEVLCSLHRKFVMSKHSPTLAASLGGLMCAWITLEVRRGKNVRGGRCYVWSGRGRSSCWVLKACAVAVIVAET
jgi:hypothetical protein